MCCKKNPESFSGIIRDKCDLDFGPLKVFEPPSLNGEHNNVKTNKIKTLSYQFHVHVRVMHKKMMHSGLSEYALARDIDIVY